MTDTAGDLKFDFRLMGGADDWGNAMHWWFTVADEIHFNRPTMSVPKDWQFRPSPLGECNDPDDYATSSVRKADDASLKQFGDLINRYARKLDYLGLSY